MRASTTRHTLAWLAMLALVALVGAACGAASSKPTGTGTGRGTTPSTFGATSTTGVSSAGAAGTGASGAKASSTGQAGSAAATGTTPAAPGTATPGGASASSGSATGAPVPVVPGTYQMRQTGSTTVGSSTTPDPASGTLVVEPAGAGGTQVSHRYVDTTKPPSDTTIQFRPNGMFLVSTVQRTVVGTQTLSYTCNFAPAMPSPPWPPAVGATFNGSANCGQFTAIVSGRITGTRQISLDGASLNTFVVQTSITTHGQITSTGTETDWFSPTLRMSVHIAVDQKGTYGPFNFDTSLTSDLVSAHPS